MLRGGYEQRGVVEVMMAAPAGCYTWLSFPGAGQCSAKEVVLWGRG